MENLEDEEAFAQGAPSGEGRCGVVNFCVWGAWGCSFFGDSDLSAGESIYFLPSFFPS